MSKSVNLIKFVTPIAMAIALSACGGSGADFGSGTTTSSSSSDGTTTDETDDTGVGEVEELVFTLQPLEIGLTALSAGGSTGLTTRLSDQNGDFASEAYSISFTSPCISNGTSDVVSPITSSNGVFTSTYTAKGCEGDDQITATVGARSVSGTVSVQAASLGAVEFVSASPQNILLQGMSAPGLAHTSTVQFQILNDVGGPIANEDVSFELTTEVGGIKLASAIGKTDNEGFVSTILQAGSVHTSVRVRATVDRDGSIISSESSNIVISTGIADQNSFSLSLSSLNPEAWNKDGVEVAVNVIASDRYNNPVPDGTAVAFYTEYGQVSSSCSTLNGRCSGTWTSSDPRDLGINDIRYPHEGITTITAKIIGEESFIDTNSNGIFDDGDILDAASDKGEAFEDYNMNYSTNSLGSSMAMNSYDEGLEPYIDFNGDGVRNPKDGLYSGLGCMHTSLCAPGDGIKDIYVSAELVMSESILSVDIYNDATGELVNEVENDIQYTVHVYGSVNKQAPPEGTTISITSDEAEFVTGDSAELQTVFRFASMFDPNRSSVAGVQGPYGPMMFSLRLKDADIAEETDGVIKVKLDGSEAIFNYNDDAVTP